MQPSLPFNPKMLSDNGLNLHCIFDIAALPPPIIEHLSSTCSHLSDYKQLILIGQGGTRLWASLPGSPPPSDNRIDDFTAECVKRWFATDYSNSRFCIIYPADPSIDLISLGTLAGWHHESPFKVGINRDWGPWFAYRSVVLADTHFQITRPSIKSSPCSSCESKPCISNCPADACANGTLDIERCIGYRKQADSKCHNTCLARTNCPVARQHGYSEQQIHYHYTASMKIIKGLT